mmetsp:Transcript_104819/g.291741  ORF Transcript_104819/g.291741 Transcript_104819/m.291741 type:complete len:245 (-) Transcript_104819:122-856(-)
MSIDLSCCSAVSRRPHLKPTPPLELQNVPSRESGSYRRPARALGVEIRSSCYACVCMRARSQEAKAQVAHAPWAHAKRPNETVKSTALDGASDDAVSVSEIVVRGAAPDEISVTRTVTPAPALASSSLTMLANCSAVTSLRLAAVASAPAGTEMSYATSTAPAKRRACNRRRAATEQASCTEPTSCAAARAMACCKPRSTNSLAQKAGGSSTVSFKSPETTVAVAELGPSMEPAAGSTKPTVGP